MTILAYHSISTRAHPLAVAPDDFARQLDQLASSHVVPLREYLGRLRSRVPTNDCVALTFDDGYRDFAEHALPALFERGYPSTTFVAPALVGSTLEVDDAGSAVDTAWPLMDWSEIAAVAAEGVEIGSHSMTHVNLTRIDDGRLKEEVTASKTALEDVLGTTIDGFCYPAGWYDDRVVAAVAAAGYTWAVVTPRTWRHQGDDLTVRRVGIYRHDDNLRFRLKLTRAGRLIGRGQRWLRGTR